MSQALVTDFFNTRKRNKFQDEALINKSRKAAAAQLGDQIVEEPTKRCLRSSRLKGGSSSIDQEPTSTKTVVEVPTPVLAAATEKETKPSRRASTRNNEKKEQLEALKARVRRLDDAKARVLPPAPVEQQPQVQQAESASTTTTTEAVQSKKRVNKAELKRRIEEFNRNLTQLQVETIKPTVEKVKEEQATQQPQQQLPAYMKSKDLASEQVDLSSTLTLPKTYSMLLDCFKGSDTIVKFLHNRDEVCTFLKLKMGIQNITKQTFAHKHLAQLKTVYPEAYTMRYEKLFIDFKNDYHLIISPNMNGILFFFVHLNYYYYFFLFRQSSFFLCWSNI